MKKIFFSKSFLPTPDKNRMKNEGDVLSARQVFITQKPSNLSALLEQRYSWMNAYTKNVHNIVEVGAGAGFSKFFIDNKNLKLSDFKSKHDWIDLDVDALNMPFEDSSMDVIISSHMIHHLATPQKFFSEVKRVLKKDGYLIISEINTSLLMRFLLRIMRHEGYSYAIDVFDKNVIANRAEDPWSANCAIPEMLFSDEEKFIIKIPGFRFVKNELCECILFPISGGVISKTFTINLPKALLKIICLIDFMLVKIAPSVFPLGRRVVLQKDE